jgi:transposase
MYANGLSARNTAATFNIAEHGSVLKWERIYNEEGPEALYRENRGRSKKMFRWRREIVSKIARNRLSSP